MPSLYQSTVERTIQIICIHVGVSTLHSRRRSNTWNINTINDKRKHEKRETSKHNKRKHEEQTQIKLIEQFTILLRNFGPCRFPPHPFWLLTFPWLPILLCLKALCYPPYAWQIRNWIRIVLSPTKHIVFVEQMPVLTLRKWSEFIQVALFRSSFVFRVSCFV